MVKRFPASLDYLHAMLQFVCDHGRQAGFQEPILYQVELAVEEALVNIIMYAFEHKNETIEIDCVSWKHQHFDVVIMDRGIPFNPLNAKKLSSVSGHESQGGWGIFFILKIMDEVHYRYEDGKNILTLIKYCPVES